MALRGPAIVALAIGLVASLSACPSSKPSSTPLPSVSSTTDPWAGLEAKPLALPTTGAKACSTGRTKFVDKAFGPALQPISGPAIVMPVGFTSTGRLGWVFNKRNLWTVWGGQKVLWVVSPRYKGAVLIRGRQLNGSNEVRFDLGLFPADKLKIGPGGGTVSSPWRDFPTYTRLRAGGCFAYQVDGDGFREIIAFTAFHDAAGDVK
jgi:hypothetical protein